jgi:hypothetical protein
MKKNNCQFRSCQFKARVKFSQKSAVKFLKTLLLWIQMTAGRELSISNFNRIFALDIHRFRIPLYKFGIHTI